MEALQKLRILEESCIPSTSDGSTDTADEEVKNEGNCDDSAVRDQRAGEDAERTKSVSGQEASEEPSLLDPRTGKPISHGQVISLWKELKARDVSPYSLDTLLRGARVYVPPPKPKTEPVWLNALSLRAFG